MQRLTRTSRIFPAPALALALAAAAGCNTSTTGDQGHIAFTPAQCGRVGCDFGDMVGVGGALVVTISGLDGFSTVGIDLESSNPEVLSVAPTGDVGQPTWALIGLAPGTAGLLAVDAARNAVDSIDVQVVQPERLTLIDFGDAVGPVAEPNYDEKWIVNANQRILFHVTPVTGGDLPVMGQYEYNVTVDPGLTADINAPDILSLGQLDFTPVNPGLYEVFFDDLFGNSLAVLIDVQPTP